ncbi:MAG: hypothetical protein PWP04_1814 [Candidatus Atribacteria bacterium]|nr:hypothetical protein [Candidatus Atribacteria bacterium]
MKEEEFLAEELTLEEEFLEQKESKIRRQLIEGNIWSSIFYLALPMTLTLFLQDAFNLIDMYFVGKLGPDALASVSMAGIIVGLILAAVAGLSFGTVAMVSRYTGRGDLDLADKVVAQSFLLGIFITLIVTVLGYIYAPQMLRLIGAEEQVVNLGTSYLRITFGGSSTIFLTVLLFSALRGAGDPVSPMIILIISTIINIILDPIMIMGLFGFPALGVAGSALATIIARAIALIMLLFVMFGGKRTIKIRVKDLRPDFSIMKKIVTIGSPSSVESVIINASALLLMSIVAAFGTITVAAYGVGMRLNMAIMIPTMGFGTAAATLVGQNLGAGKPKRAENSGWFCAGISSAIMLLLSLLLFSFSQEAVRIFNRDPQVIEIGSQFIRYVAPSFPFIAMAMSLGRGLNGAGDTFHTMLFSTISLLLVRIPLAWLLPRFMGIRGIWAALACTNLLYGIIVAGWFKLGKWKEKKI